MDDNILLKIIEKFKIKIIFHLTIGKRDNNMTQYSDDQIKEFITNNEEQILNSANTMYNDYERDNELTLISNDECENDWYREYIEELLT